MEYPAEFCQGCLGGLREHFTRAPSDVYILCGSAIPLAKIDALCQDIANEGCLLPIGHRRRHAGGRDHPRLILLETAAYSHAITEGPPSPMNDRIEFLNRVSNLFGPDALGEIPLLDALVCTIVVVSDYARQNFNANMRQHLVDIILDDDRRMPRLIDTRAAERQRH